MGEEKRHQMMQNLFGDQSEEEEEEEEEELDSEHDASRHPHSLSDEGEGGAELEGESEVEGHGEAEAENEGELNGGNLDPGESEGEREQSLSEREVGDQREESKEEEVENDEQGIYGQRLVTGRRQEIVESGSERSQEHHNVENEDEEVDQAKELRSSSEDKDRTHVSHSAAEIHDVFGDSDEDESAEYAAQNDLNQENESPMEEERINGNNLRPEDVVPDEDVQFESEEESIEQQPKEKRVGPPLELEIPLHPPPAQPDKMNMIKVSNIMGIEPKPFDPKAYVEEDMFITDESGSKKRIRLENNIVRWRTGKNPDGTLLYESNARFVRWSDGSIQLLIGNEILDISVQDAQHDQVHLFLRHGKGILQSQGRLLRKMRFMPSSLSSNSHKLLTALVDSRHKKVYKVKKCITDIDPEREKEEKEKAESQTIRAHELLHRKREKVNRKYTQKVERHHQLSPGFLEEALDEDDEPDHYESRRSAPQPHFEEDMEAEAQAEKRIINAKKSQLHKDRQRKSSLSTIGSSRKPAEDFSESGREESEYESDGDEDKISPPLKKTEEPYHKDEEYEQDEEAGVNEASEEEEAKDMKRMNKESGRNPKRKEIESEEDSPPRKIATHRRMAVVYDSDEE